LKKGDHREQGEKYGDEAEHDGRNNQPNVNVSHARMHGKRTLTDDGERPLSGINPCRERLLIGGDPDIRTDQHPTGVSMRSMRERRFPVKL
jgi:hypothetical protein